MNDINAQLISYLKGIAKYRWHAMLVAWLVAVAGWSTVFNLPDTYQSSSRVYVDTQTILKPLLSSMTSFPNVEQQVSIMSRTLLSRPNIERVMRMVDLDIKAKTLQDREKILTDLEKNLKISGTVQNDIYTISYTGKDPQLTKDVVQAILTIFVEGSLGDKKGDSLNAIQFIEQQIKVSEGKLIATESALKDFKLKNMGVLFHNGTDYNSQLAREKDNLSRAKLELAEAEQARDAIRKQMYGEEKELGSAFERVSHSHPDTFLETRIREQEKVLDNLRMSYTDKHPDIVSAKRLLTQLEAERFAASKAEKSGLDRLDYANPMLQQLKLSLSTAEAQVAALKARVQEYDSRVARLNAMRTAIPEIETQLAQLNRDYHTHKAHYDKLVASREAAALSSNLSATTEMMTFRVIDPPSTPLRPAGPNRVALTSAIMAAALLAGVGVALLLNHLRPIFLTQGALQNATGLPVIGSISAITKPNSTSSTNKQAYFFGGGCILLAALYGAILLRLLNYV